MAEINGLNLTYKIAAAMYKKLIQKFRGYLIHVDSGINAGGDVLDKNASSIQGKEFGLTFCKPKSLDDFISGKVGESTGCHITAYFTTFAGHTSSPILDYAELICEEDGMKLSNDGMADIGKTIPSNTVPLMYIAKLRIVIQQYLNFYTKLYNNAIESGINITKIYMTNEVKCTTKKIESKCVKPVQKDNCNIKNDILAVCANGETGAGFKNIIGENIFKNELDNLYKKPHCVDIKKTHAHKHKSKEHCTSNESFIDVYAYKTKKSKHKKKYSSKGNIKCSSKENKKCDNKVYSNTSDRCVEKKVICVKECDNKIYSSSSDYKGHYKKSKKCNNFLYSSSYDRGCSSYANCVK
jgi:hypothetical protein